MSEPTTVTERDISRAYTTLAMIDVCGAATAYLEEAGPSVKISSSICTTLRYAQELAGLTVDLLETIQSDQKKAGKS